MWTQRIGKIGQDIAQKYFENNGYCLIAKNWHSRYGEIDLILGKRYRSSTATPENVFGNLSGDASEKWNELIFCEVKTRVIYRPAAESLASGKTPEGDFRGGFREDFVGRFGSGEESLDRRKRRKILKTIFVYLEKNPGFAKTSWRLDLVCVNILLRRSRRDGLNFSGCRKNAIFLYHYRNISIFD